MPAETHHQGRYARLRVRDGPVPQRARRSESKGNRHRTQIHPGRGVRQAGGGEGPGGLPRRGRHRGEAEREEEQRGRAADRFLGVLFAGLIANAAASLKEKGSKIVVEKGQIVKMTKDKKGIVSREGADEELDRLDRLLVGGFRLREQARDHPREETRQTEPTQSEDGKSVWTGDYIFENEWQSFRTKKDRTLELTSVYRECPPEAAQDRGEGGGHLRQRHDDDRGSGSGREEVMALHPNFPERPARDSRPGDPLVPGG